MGPSERFNTALHVSENDLVLVRSDGGIDIYAAFGTSAGLRESSAESPSPVAPAPCPLVIEQLAKTRGLLQRGSGFADTVESRLLFSFFRAAHG